MHGTRRDPPSQPVTAARGSLCFAPRRDLGCDTCLHCPLIKEWDLTLCATPLARGGLAPELASIGTLRQLFIKGQEISGD